MKFRIDIHGMYVVITNTSSTPAEKQKHKTILMQKYN